MHLPYRKEEEEEDDRGRKQQKIKGSNRLHPTEDTPLLNKILMKRSTLFQYHNKVHFDKMVEGCLIKINYGNSAIKDNYKIGIIVGVIRKNERYEFEGKQYNIYLKVRVGGGKEFDTSMLNASNKEIHESQAYRLLEELQDSCDFPLDRSWVKSKIKELEEYANYQLTLEDIQNLQDQRIQKLSQPDNFEQYIQKKNAFEQKLKLLERQNFKSPSKEKQEKIQELNEQLNELQKEIGRYKQNRSEFLEIYTKKEKEFLEFGQIDKQERAVFERKQANPLNMWTIDYNDIEHQEMKPNPISDYQLPKAKQSCQDYEEILGNFLNLFNRPLEIDSLVDSLK